MRSHTVLTSILPALAIIGGLATVSGCGGSDTVKTVTAAAPTPTAPAASAVDLQTAYERVVQRVSPSGSWRSRWATRSGCAQASRRGSSRRSGAPSARAMAR